MVGFSVMRMAFIQLSPMCYPMMRHVTIMPQILAVGVTILMVLMEIPPVLLDVMVVRANVLIVRCQIGTLLLGTGRIARLNILGQLTAVGVALFDILVDIRAVLIHVPP